MICRNKCLVAAAFPFLHLSVLLLTFPCQVFKWWLTRTITCRWIFIYISMKWLVGPQRMFYICSPSFENICKALSASKSFLPDSKHSVSVRQRSNDCAAAECSCQWGIKGPTVTTARVHYTLSSFHLIWLTARLLLLTNQPSNQPSNLPTN